MKGQFTYLLVIVFVFCGICGSISAQDLELFYSRFGVDDGLPTNTIYYVAQDKNGYIWVGTKYGICRYDGHMFEQFSGPPDINNQQVFSIKEDHKGRIWFSTPKSGLFYVLHDSIHAYKYNDIIQGMADSFRLISRFSISNEGTIHIGLEKLGIIEIDEHGTYKIYSHEYESFDQLILESSSDILSATLELPKQKRSARHDSGPLGPEDRAPMIRQDGSLTYLPYPKGATSQYHLTGAKSKTNDILISSRGFIYYYKQDSLVDRVENKQGIGNFTISENGNVLISLLDGGGARIFENISGVINNDGKSILKGYSVTKAIQAINGGVWASTLNKGLIFIPDLNQYFLQEAPGSVVDIVTNKSSVFVGMDNGNIYQIQKHNALFKVKRINQDLPFIQDLAINPKNGNLWVALRNGLMFYDGAKWRNKLRNSRFSHKVIEFSENGSEILGLAGIGFTTIDPNTGEIEYVSSLKDNSYHFYQDAVLTKSGKIFLADETNVFQYDRSKVKSNPSVNACELPSENNVRFLEELNDTTILAITLAGKIYRLDTRDIPSIVGTLDLDTKVSQVVKFGSSSIWICSDSDILEYACIDGKDSINSIPFYHPGSEVTAFGLFDNFLLTGTVNGLIIQPIPEKLNGLDSVLLKSIRVDNKSISPKGAFAICYGQNLTIDYTALNFRQYGGVTYRFRLKESENWEQTKNTSLSLNYLEPNEYTFNVQYKTVNGDWSQGKKLTFLVKPPWWATWWFRGLLLFVVGGVSYSYYRDKTNALKREVQSQKRIQELEKEALQAQMNPHFIFNCLSAIQYLINTDQKKKANIYLVKFADLIRQTLNNSLGDKITLENEIKMLSNYLNLEQLRFEDKFTYRIDLAQDLLPHRVNIPPMLIQPYVENAIIHGLSDREKEGQIHIVFEKNDDFLVVTITDNGVGLNQAKIRDKESSHKSVGMIVSRERLTMLNNSDQVTSLEVDEVKSSTGKSGGTRVVVRIRLEQDGI